MLLEMKDLANSHGIQADSRSPVNKSESSADTIVYMEGSGTSHSGSPISKVLRRLRRLPRT